MEEADATDMPSPILHLLSSDLSCFQSPLSFLVMSFARFGQKHSFIIPAEILRDFSGNGVKSRNNARVGRST